MSTIYLRKEEGKTSRKVLIDMAYLSSNKKIRLPQYKFEEGLYFLYKPKGSEQIDKYFLTKDKIISQDSDFFYFAFPFKISQAESYSA